MASSPVLIQSRHNVHFKQWLEYATRPEQSDCPWIAVEGWKQIQDLSERHSIQLLLFADFEDTRVQALLPRAARSCRISARLLGRLSAVESPQPVVAFFQKPSWKADQLTPWVLYLDRVQDPGNLGTLLRTAASTGIFSLAMRPGTVSCFNPKVVRASAGLLFGVPFLENAEATELKKRGYHLWASTPTKGLPLFQADLRQPLAILLGSEGQGLDPAILALADHPLHIPMDPGAQSLNVSVAGSLIMYEVIRQRAVHG